MIWIKSTTEEFRYSRSAIINVNDDNHTASNPLGSLLWKWNEIWTAGGQGLVKHYSCIDNKNNNKLTLGDRQKPTLSGALFHVLGFPFFLLMIKSNYREWGALTLSQ